MDSEVINLADDVEGVKYVSMGLGLSPGQATYIAVRTDSKYTPVAQVHVGVSTDGEIVVAVERTKNVKVTIRDTQLVDVRSTDTFVRRGY